MNAPPTTLLQTSTGPAAPADAVVVQPLCIGPAGGRAFLAKDSLDVAGWPTRCGSPALADAAPAAAHAEAVQRLLDAGWQLRGKTNLHELAFGTTGINHWTGTPRNPRWPDRVPGGSSSGSAVAVAEGRVDLALGTDTGGSIRTPAACCGVFGLKPSYGRVSRVGAAPTLSTLDCVGPIAADMATLCAAMAALVPGFGTLPGLPDRLRIGALQVEAGAPARAALQSALARSGAELVPVALPLFDAAYRAGLAIINRENWLALAPLLQSGLLGADIATRLARAGHTSDAEVAAAEAVRAAFRAQVDAALAQVDVLALPTLGAPPPRLTEATDTSAAVAMTTLVRPFNLSGHPAITLPLDDADGLPVGLQLVAGWGRDEWLCAVASHLTDTLGLRAHQGETA